MAEPRATGFRLLLIVGLFIFLAGLVTWLFYWMFIGALLVLAALGFIWREAPITDRRSFPKEPRRRRWLA